MRPVHVIGGGLAGSEAAWQAARAGVPVVLHELVAQGNTVVVIEHNLEVIKTADWVIDLGPEGGDGGGEIVAWGPPEDIVKAPRSYTGKFLAPVLKKADGKPRKSSGAS